MIIRFSRTVNKTWAKLYCPPKAFCGLHLIFNFGMWPMNAIRFSIGHRCFPLKQGSQLVVQEKVLVVCRIRVVTKVSSKKTVHYANVFKASMNKLKLRTSKIMNFSFLLFTLFTTSNFQNNLLKNSNSYLYFNRRPKKEKRS